ncbi:DUF2784 domain-containing protein [Haloechinothrix alba]|nr:DUF2784 domain-containing protein [Haloechinothrix alba]
MYRVLADATMSLHLAFLAYVLLGGFLAWRWPRAIVPHAIATGWAVTIVTFGFTCPLTPLENHFRAEAGERGAGSGFIEHYLADIVYPQQHIELLWAASAVVVLVSWAGLAVLLRRRSAVRG